MTYSDEERMQIACIVKQAQFDRKWTQAQLSKKAGYDPRVLRTILQGKTVKERTLHDYFEALELPWPPRINNEKTHQSSKEVGGYTKESLSHYEGSYIYYRKDFTLNNVFSKSRCQIQWDYEKQCYMFYEGRQNSYHSGRLLHNSHLSLIHLESVFQGAVRLITLCKLDFVTQMMQGVILTQLDKGLGYQPCVSPITFQKISDKLIPLEEIPKPESITIEKNDEFQKCSDALEQACNKWVHIIK